MNFVLWITLSLVTSVLSFENPAEVGFFSGRISKIQESSGLIRLRIDFANMKYLNKKDKVEFWDERGDSGKCYAYIVGKSNEYALLKAQNFQACRYNVLIKEGAYIKAYSKDLENNIKMGKELIDVLLKKRVAIYSKYSKSKKNLDRHIEKVNAINLRYKTLRDKLESRWRKELTELEEDRALTYKRYKENESSLFDVDHKLEKYRIEDENLKLDRWSLDSKLYFKK